VLKLRKTEIEQRVSEELERLARVEARLKQIEQEDVMNKVDVVVKKVEPIKIASVREVIPTYGEQGGIWRELEGYLATQRVHPVGPCLTMYHDEEYKERDVDAEVAEPITAELTETARVRVRSLPAAEVVSAVHRGPYRIRNLGMPSKPLSNGQKPTATASSARSARSTCSRGAMAIRMIPIR
jgi:hypothetical protein